MAVVSDATPSPFAPKFFTLTDGFAVSAE